MIRTMPLVVVQAAETGLQSSDRAVLCRFTGLILTQSAPKALVPIPAFHADNTSQRVDMTKLGPDLHSHGSALHFLGCLDGCHDIALDQRSV